MRYLGLVSQLFVIIVIFLFIGKKIDAFLHFEKPWFIWILPLVIIIFTLIKLVVETSKNSK
jgi:hypothetical protein